MQLHLFRKKSESSERFTHCEENFKFTLMMMIINNNKHPFNFQGPAR
jgi:hypothetical protein